MKTGNRANSSAHRKAVSVIKPIRAKTSPASLTRITGENNSAKDLSKPKTPLKNRRAKARRFMLFLKISMTFSPSISCKKAASSGVIEILSFL